MYYDGDGGLSRHEAEKQAERLLREEYRLEQNMQC